jgi:hypothetical protein
MDRSDPTRRVTRYGNARIHTFNYGGVSGNYGYGYQIFIGNDLHIYHESGGFSTRAKAVAAARKFAAKNINIWRPSGYKSDKRRYRRRRHNPKGGLLVPALVVGALSFAGWYFFVRTPPSALPPATAGA